MKFLNEKPLVAVIFSFILGISVMGLIFTLSTPDSSNLASRLSQQTLTPEQIQERMSMQKAAMEARQNKPQLSGVNMSGARPTNMERPMAWQAAISLLEKAPIEKIEVKGLDLKISLKGGVVFTTTQDKADAYVALIKKNPAKIEIIK